MTLAATIVGGGIGGLTAALTFDACGIEATVLERTVATSGATSGGSGLTLWSNAARILRQLGLLDEIVANGSLLATFENRTWQGAPLARWPIARMSQEAGAPSVNITRATLHDILRTNVGHRLISGATVAHVHDTKTAAVAELESGVTYAADVLIGADGLRSRVRDLLVPPAPPRFAGYAAYRALVPEDAADVASGVFTQHWGPGRRFGYYRVGQGQVYWVAVLPCREAERYDAATFAPLLREGFAGWAGAVTDLLAATPDDAISRVRVFDRDPMKTWGAGRLTLLGDAVHPMTFNIGQGACQAMEDAAVLAHALRTAASPVAGLRSYEDLRRDRVAPLVRRARRIGELGQWERPSLCRARNVLLRAVLAGPARREHQRDLRATHLPVLPDPLAPSASGTART